MKRLIKKAEDYNDKAFEQLNLLYKINSEIIQVQDALRKDEHHDFSTEIIKLSRTRDTLYTIYVEIKDRISEDS